MIFWHFCICSSKLVKSLYLRDQCLLRHSREFPWNRGSLINNIAERLTQDKWCTLGWKFSSWYNIGLTCEAGLQAGLLPPHPQQSACCGLLRSCLPWTSHPSHSWPWSLTKRGNRPSQYTHGKYHNLEETKHCRKVMRILSALQCLLWNIKLQTKQSNAGNRCLNINIKNLFHKMFVSCHRLQSSYVKEKQSK